MNRTRSSRARPYALSKTFGYKGGFLLVEVQLATQPLLNPIERAATAQTLIRDNRFHLLLRADLDERELSISLYHEALEAATVAALTPPDAVMETE